MRLELKEVGLDDPGCARTCGRDAWGNRRQGAHEGPANISRKPIAEVVRDR
jgi:hypothetical protein